MGISGDTPHKRSFIKEPLISGSFAERDLQRKAPSTRCVGISGDTPFVLAQKEFHKRATNYRALVREMTYEDKASHGSSPLCIKCVFAGVWYKAAKTNRMPYMYRSFSAKEPYN